MYTAVSGTCVNTNDEVDIDTLGDATVGLELSGTWTGTVTFEAKVGVTWVTLAGPPAGGGAAVSSATGNGTWVLPAAGFKRVRARFSTASSGTVSVALESTGGGASGANAGATTVDDGSLGAFSYAAGNLTSGSLAQAGARLTGLRVYANGADSTFNINGGATITVRNGAGFDWSPREKITSATVYWLSGNIDVWLESAT